MNGKVMLLRQFASLRCCVVADPDVPGDLNIQAAPEVVENGKFSILAFCARQLQLDLASISILYECGYPWG